MNTTAYAPKPLCKPLTVNAFGIAPEVEEDLDHVTARYIRPYVLKVLHANPHPIHNEYEVIGIAKSEYNDIEERACSQSLLTMASEIKDMIIKLTALYIKLTFQNNIPRI